MLVTERGLLKPQRDILSAVTSGFWAQNVPPRLPLAIWWPLPILHHYSVKVLCSRKRRRQQMSCGRGSTQPCWETSALGNIKAPLWCAGSWDPQSKLHSPCSQCRNLIYPWSCADTHTVCWCVCECKYHIYYILFRRCSCRLHLQMIYWWCRIPPMNDYMMISLPSFNLHHLMLVFA